MFLIHLSIAPTPASFLYVYVRVYVRVRVRAISVCTGSCMCAWEAGFESEALPPTQVGVVEAPELRSRSFANVRRNV